MKLFSAVSHSLKGKTVRLLSVKLCVGVQGQDTIRRRIPDTWAGRNPVT